MLFMTEQILSTRADIPGVDYAGWLNAEPGLFGWLTRTPGQSLKTVTVPAKTERMVCLSLRQLHVFNPEVVDQSTAHPG